MRAQIAPVPLFFVQDHQGRAMAGLEGRKNARDRQVVQNDGKGGGTCGGNQRQTDRHG